VSIAARTPSMETTHPFLLSQRTPQIEAAQKKKEQKIKKSLSPQKVEETLFTRFHNNTHLLWCSKLKHKLTHIPKESLWQNLETLFTRIHNKQASVVVQ
jgi:hypothetical protein